MSDLARRSIALLQGAWSLTARNSELLLLLTALMVIVILMSMLHSFPQISDQLTQIGAILAQEDQDPQRLLDALGPPVSTLGRLLLIPAMLAGLLNPLLSLVFIRAVALGKEHAFDGGLAMTVRRYAKLLWVSIAAIPALLLFILLSGTASMLIMGLFGSLFGLIGLGGLATFLANIVGTCLLLIAVAGVYLAQVSQALDEGHGVFKGIALLVDRHQELLVALILVYLVASVLTEATGALSPTIMAWLQPILAVATTGIGLSAAVLVHRADDNR